LIGVIAVSEIEQLKNEKNIKHFSSN